MQYKSMELFHENEEYKIFKNICIKTKKKENKN